MRRWFAVFLLILLPLQFSWAAVASYCGHENEAQARHFGHHEHQHQHQEDADVDSGTGTISDGPAGSSPGSFDFDCGHCHGSCAGLLQAQKTLPSLVKSSRPGAPVEGFARTLAPTPPERPQWASLA
jgi:DNA-directed RNA polymerase subunit M/transcription elongation factor TFIIS